MKIVVTGAAGLIGWHASARLHALNCAARFRGEALPHQLVALSHDEFADTTVRNAALNGADAVLHFAGVNRAGSDAEVERSNPEIARLLVESCHTANQRPHIVYANSTHASSDTPYGRSKRIAGEILADLGGAYSDLVLPHIFGECARPRYNNVTATFIEAAINGQRPEVNPEGRVALLHAGAAAQTAIDAVLSGQTGRIAPEPRVMGVPELLDRLVGFHSQYQTNVFPDLGDGFTRDLFNSYRAALYPAGFPRPLTLHSDPRGSLFEAVKGGGGGQSFVSWTKPGITRGDHFHLHKVERFLVLEGEAIIRIRRVLGGPVWEYRVSGEAPSPVDMPTLHTHSIENIGSRPLLTMFWTHDLFDPAAPDTYADPVIKA